MSSTHVPAVLGSVSSLSSHDLDSVLRENRVFPPPEEFSRDAQIKSIEQYESMYKQSIEAVQQGQDPVGIIREPAKNKMLAPVPGEFQVS